MYYAFFFLSQLVLPLCFGIGLYIDRPFQLASEPVVLILLTALTVFLTVKLHRGKDSFLAIPVPFFAMVNGISMLLFLDWWGSIPIAVVLAVCGWVIFFRSPGKVMKVVCQVLYVLMTILFILLLPIFLFAAFMGYTTIHQELVSPGEGYTAQLVESDQGALGGYTMVKVRDNAFTIPLGFGSFSREFTVYSGDWGEHQDMVLSWQDENTLLINGEPYAVDAAALESRRNALDGLGSSMPKGRVVYHSDDHGGFHGDGTTILVLSGEASIPDSRFWHDLPMAENVRAALEAYLPDGLPPVTEGRWFCLDRHSKAADPADPSVIFSHGSLNFTVALYDAENQMLYYIKVDT